MGRCRPLTTYCFMQTDGSQEAHPPSSELFGLQRTLDFFKDRRAMAVSQISKEIWLEVCNFVGSRYIADDMAAIIVRRIG